MDKETIVVNGTLYDAITGMPLPKQTESTPVTLTRERTTKPSQQVHRRVEPSRAQGRRAESRPLIQKRQDMKRVAPQSAVKSPAITRFAKQSAQPVTQRRVMNDIRPATPHPVAKRAEERLALAQPKPATSSLVKPSAVLKKEAIDEALSKAPRHKAAKPIKHAKRFPRLASFASAALAMILLAGYLTYINLPNLSVRVAASQAGINANYPGYKPDGYRLAGVNYQKGSVTLKFASNAGPQNFTITQQQTSWDSTAVKENYVKTNWGDDVVPYSERGLTIYAHQNGAAWVNGGILYTITGDAPLSTSQVRSIATSL